MQDSIIALVCAMIGVAVGFGLTRLLGAGARKAAAESLEATRAAAKQEAEAIVKDARLTAKENQIKLRDEFEVTTEARRKELAQTERELKDREALLDRKMDQVQNRLDEITRRDENLARAERELRDQKDAVAEVLKQQRQALQDVAGLTQDEARAKMLAELEHELANERGAAIRLSAAEAHQTAQRESQKIMVQAMQRYAGDVAYDRTTCTVPLPSDDMKGRIIGREGRNIRVFEATTGVNVLIDDTPQAVVISCFEPVRREIARLSLERLVADGRIHPSRVEEVVAKAREDIESEASKAGAEALETLQLTGAAPEVVQMLGRLRFRYSFTQNVLAHSIEVASLMGMIAAELRLDVQKAKRMGLFHDIGKAMDQDVDGGHAIIGMDFLKRFDEDPEVLNGVGCHHDEIPADSPLAALVCVADALSASRPGARSESTDLYIKRLEQLERIGTSYPGVETCFAVQAGREIRVIVEPDSISENEAYDLSRNIAQQIEDEMQYPGQIKVCVIRETRSVKYAK